MAESKIPDVAESPGVSAISESLGGLRYGTFVLTNRLGSCRRTVFREPFVTFRRPQCVTANPFLSTCHSNSQNASRLASVDNVEKTPAAEKGLSIDKVGGRGFNGVFELRYLWLSPPILLMGQIRFRISNDCLLSDRVLSSVHMLGFDKTVWPCRCEVEDDVLIESDSQPTIQTAGGTTLIVHRHTSQSGHLFLLYPFAAHGELVIGTATLVEREAPYCLETELARGTLNRLRNLISNWCEGGLEIPASIRHGTATSSQEFSQAIFSGDPQRAGRVIELTMSLMLDLGIEFGRQVAGFRQAANQPREIHFVIRGAEEVGQKVAQGAAWDELAKMSNAAYVPAGLSCDLKSAPTLSVAQLESDDSQTIDAMAHQAAIDALERFENRFRRTPQDQYTIVGPLLDASPNGLPDPIRKIKDASARKETALHEIRQSIAHLKGKPYSLVHAAAGINGVGSRYLTFSQQIQLTVDIVHATEESLRQAPILISFDQPWGERLAWSVGGASSLQIADTLLRHGCRIDAIGLEVNLDYWPSGSLPRDPSHWNELLDEWSMFSLPLWIFLRMPVEAHGDSKGSSHGEIKMPSLRSRKQRRLGALNAHQQANLLRSSLPVVLGRPQVQGIVWNQSSNEDFFSDSALKSDHANPILESWTEIARAWDFSVGRSGR